MDELERIKNSRMRHTMEALKMNIESEVMTATETAVMDHTTCCLCGSDLKFDHKIDFGTLTVVEDAHCPSCRIQLRTKQHVLN